MTIAPTLRALVFPPVFTTALILLFLGIGEVLDYYLGGFWPRGFFGPDSKYGREAAVLTLFSMVVMFSFCSRIDPRGTLDNPRGTIFFAYVMIVIPLVTLYTTPPMLYAFVPRESFPTVYAVVMLLFVSIFVGGWVSEDKSSMDPNRRGRFARVFGYPFVISIVSIVFFAYLGALHDQLLGPDYMPAWYMRGAHFHKNAASISLFSQVVTAVLFARINMVKQTSAVQLNFLRAIYGLFFAITALYFVPMQLYALVPRSAMPIVYALVMLLLESIFFVGLIRDTNAAVQPATQSAARPVAQSAKKDD